MISLSQALYTPLMEEKIPLKSWDKQTIDYALSHKSKIKVAINCQARTMGTVARTFDLEDCFNDLLMYLYNAEDYDIDTAFEKAKCDIGGTPAGIGIDGYVLACARYQALKYFSDSISNACKTKSEYSIGRESDEELSIFDTIEDANASKGFDLQPSLEEVCKLYESKRYNFVVDIYMMWFVRLLTIKYNKKDSYDEVLTILGIRKSDMKIVNKRESKAGVMLDMAKAISRISLEEAIETLRDYTYGANRIEKVVILISTEGDKTND